MKSWRWFPSVVSIELRRMLSYRADFWVLFLGGMAAQMALAYFLWRAVFDARGVESLRGYTLPGMLLYYMLVALANRLVRGSESTFVSRDIYDGSLNRYLVYPVSFFGYRYAVSVAGVLLFALQLGAALALFVVLVGVPQGVSMSWQGFGMGLAVALLAGVMHFFLTLTVEFTAFWADNVWSLLVMLRFVTYLLGGGMLPLEFFPDFMREALAWTPFPYVFSIPIRLWMGTLTPAAALPGLGIVLAWTLAFAGAAQIVWRRGLLRYTGVGI